MLKNKEILLVKKEIKVQRKVTYVKCFNHPSLLNKNYDFNWLRFIERCDPINYALVIAL